MIKFQWKINKEHNSLCQIIKDENIIYLTEKELVNLIDQIYQLRPDAFEDSKVGQTILDLNDTIEILKESNV